MPSERLIAEAISADGSFRIWMPSKFVFAFRLAGDISEGLGLEFVQGLDGALGQASHPVTVFANLMRLHRYHPSLGVHLLATFLAQPEMVPVIHTHAPEEAKSILVALAAANVALKGRIRVHPDWERFQRRLRLAIGRAGEW